jgi:flagellar biosynthesis chaperone FliJ
MSISSQVYTQINEHQSGLNEFKSILSRTEQSYREGKITEEEYKILKSRCLESINEQEMYIRKLQSINVNDSTSNSTSIWPTLIGLIIGIYGVLWFIKMIKG